MSVIPRVARAPSITRGSRRSASSHSWNSSDGHVRLLAGPVLPARRTRSSAERDARLVGAAVVAVPADRPRPRGAIGSPGAKSRTTVAWTARAARSRRSASARRRRGRGAGSPPPRGSPRPTAGRAGAAFRRPSRAPPPRADAGRHRRGSGRRAQPSQGRTAGGGFGPPTGRAAPWRGKGPRHGGRRQRLRAARDVRTAAADGARPAERAATTGSSGRLGVNSHVSNSASSSCPEIRSASAMNSGVVTLPPALRLRPRRGGSGRSPSSPTASRSACSVIAPRT